MAESQPFKNFYNQTLVQTLAQQIQSLYPTFPSEAFSAQIMAKLDTLEFKARVALITAALRDHLPPDYPAALEIIMGLLGPELGNDNGVFDQGFEILPLVTFVEYYGLEHFEISMRAMYEITKRFSSEFAVRPYLVRYPDETLAKLRGWLDDPNQHVRRWISEGTRPRLPWGMQLTAFIRDPSPTLPLLEHLKDDPELYVRRSVANHLNDITKDHPQRIIELAERWLQGASAERRWIVNYALRTLVKKGDAQALVLLGYGNGAALHVPQFSVNPTTAVLGDKLNMALTLTNQGSSAQQVVIDYRVHYVKANGKTSPKVFKWTTCTLNAGETITLAKTHSLRPVTTRVHYSGTHPLDIQVNGQVLASTQFELTV